jgi:peptidoglycan/xylan/chitin deacetylase (PgdA/CDA1 family)
MRRLLPTGLLLLAVLAGRPALAQTTPYPWPDGKRAAVSLAYDDALDSQLDNAIPALDRHGLKGSFYLQLSSATVRLRMEDWRRAARHGHELGNHTLFHQCSASLQDRGWVEPQRDLDTTTAAQMKDQVLLANVMLAAIDGQHERTLTVPCGDVMARAGNYIDRVADQFVAIKLGHAEVIDDMRALDLQAVPVIVPVGVTGAQLIAHVEAAAARGTMVNFTFHGIGGDHLAVSNEAHEALLAYLARHRDRYWVDTFVNLMRHVRDQRAASP